MQCFICVTYMIIVCSARPSRDKEIAERSLFSDVIESFRIRSQLPNNMNQNIENNLNHNFDRFNYDNELPQLPSDADFIPRRNDRIEMPPLKYRFPKSLSDINEDKLVNTTKQEVVIYIDTNENKVTRTTQKPKKTKRPPQAGNKNKITNKKEETNVENSEDTDTTESSYIPISNTMAGQSQIGNRESQTVVKPTVIVNFRGTLSHRDSDIRIESRSENDTLDTAQNIFNINQEVNLENRKDPNPMKPTHNKGIDLVQHLEIPSNTKEHKTEEIFTCETAQRLQEKNSRLERKMDNVVQILLSL
ncbi:hypothetical protein ACJJTC_005465 [Scirpophaga incertulas]